MYIDKKYNQYGLLIITVLFISLIVNLFIKNEVDFGYLTIDVSDLLHLTLQDDKTSAAYIIIKRFKQCIILLLLIKAIKANNVYYGFIVLSGVILGLMLCVQQYYIGFNGVVIFMLYLLPHYLLYYSGIYYAKKIDLFGIGTEHNIKKICIFTFIMSLGIVCESIFMTFFLKNFYQYMVS